MIARGGEKLFRSAGFFWEDKSSRTIFAPSSQGTREKWKIWFLQAMSARVFDIGILRLKCRANGIESREPGPRLRLRIGLSGGICRLPEAELRLLWDFFFMPTNNEQ